jgi:predicted nuclease with TOPRIM domain
MYEKIFNYFALDCPYFDNDRNWVALGIPNSLKMQKMATDITEIVEKEYDNRIDCDLCNDLQDENEKLKADIKECEEVIQAQQTAWSKRNENGKKLSKEIAELKKQIEDIKYLDRDKAENILDHYGAAYANFTLKNISEAKFKKERIKSILMLVNLATSKEISSLAIPSRDKIIEVLNKYSELSAYYDRKIIRQPNFEQIADEILKGE